ncbi:MAG: MATE family efflux transporter, partial [Deltaproteobacteria bacterium]
MRSRLVTLLALALPMVLARATQSVITFADAIQVKDLGSDAIAATATGGLNTMTFVMLPMGLAFIVQSFVAQLVGRGDRDQTRRFAWYGLGFAALAGIVAAIAIPFVTPVLGLASYTPEVRDLMASYMQIRLLSVVAAVGIEALGNWYGGLGNTWMQMIA